MIYIISAQLCLRSFELTDAGSLAAYRSEPAVLQFQDYASMNITAALQYIKENAQYILGEPGEWVQLAIALKETNSLIGDIGVKIDVDSTRIATVGITIASKAQRKGYAKEAMQALLALLFELYTCDRVVALIIADNIASIRLFQSLGFRQEAFLKQQVFFKGRWTSEYQFTCLSSEWKSNVYKSK